VRRAGKVPAVLYGGSKRSLQVNPGSWRILGVGSATRCFSCGCRVEKKHRLDPETQWEPVRGGGARGFKRVLMDRRFVSRFPSYPGGPENQTGGVFELLAREVEVGTAVCGSDCRSAN
jgi:hypothetical protein